MYRSIRPLLRFLRRGVRRTPMLLLMLLVAVIGIRIWWGRVADRRIAAFIADAKARGEPTTVGDIKLQTVPADQNGAVLIFQAAHDLRIDSHQRDWLERVHDTGFPVDGSDLDVWNQIQPPNSRVFEQVRQGRLKPVIAASSVNGADVQFGRCIQLAELLERRAITASEKGPQRDALEDILDVFAIGRSVRAETHREDFFRVSAERVDDLALSAIAIMVSNSPASQPVSQTDRQTILGLIKMLLDDDEPKAAYQCECYSNGIATIEQTGFNQMFLAEHGLLADFLDPAARLDALREAKCFFTAARSVQASPINFDQIDLQIHERRSAYDGPGVRVWLHMNEWAPRARAKLGRFCGYLTRRRIAASALALYLYSADHAGDYPESLDALVPQYLPAVPLDPFGQKTQKIAYIVFKQAVEVSSPRYGGSMQLPKAIDQDRD